MRAPSLPPWSKVALCVLACVCSLAYLPRGDVHPGKVAPPKLDDGSSPKGRVFAEDLSSAEDRHSAEDRYSAAPRPQQAVVAEEEEGTEAAAPGVLEVGATTPGGAEEEGHRSLRLGEREALEIVPHEDRIDKTLDGHVALAGASTSRARHGAVRPPASPEQCWVFMHLQKCGGSTVKNIMKRTWGSRYFVYDSVRWTLGDEFSAEFGAKLARGDTWNVMAGGYTEALRRSEPAGDGCRFFTLFRHPIARMVSAYFYCRSAWMDVACASEAVQAKNVDLLTFAKHWGNFALRQFALGFVPSDGVQEYIRTPEARALHDFDLKKVAGWYQLKMYLERPQTGGSGASGQSEAMTVQKDAAATTPDAPLYALLQPAMDLITHGYVAVGILEKWNTTLQLFDHALEMPGVHWGAQFAFSGRKNVDNMNKQLEEETLQQAWTDSELKKYMRLDLLLYEHAVDVFHQQARMHGLL